MEYKGGQEHGLYPHVGENHPSFYLADKPLVRVEEAEYLGVTITVHGISNSKTLGRVKAARRRLSSLVSIVPHGKGLPTAWCLRMYKSLVRLMLWELKVRTTGHLSVGNCGDFELERSATTRVYIH